MVGGWDDEVEEEIEVKEIHEKEKPKILCEFCGRSYVNISSHKKKCTSNPMNQGDDERIGLLCKQIAETRYQMADLQIQIRDLQNKPTIDIKEKIKIMCCSLITTWGGKSKTYISMLKDVINHFDIEFTPEEKQKYSKKITF